MNLESYQLVWEDDFNYEGRPDPAKWTFDVGNQWFNRELQAYTDRESNIYVDNGNLVIRAIKEKQGDKEYTSARIKTKGIEAWTYGYFEFRAKLPKGVGSWPAIWMLPDHDRLTEEDKERFTLLPRDFGWPNSGEIDIMEHIGRRQNNLLFSVHCKNHNHADPTPFVIQQPNSLRKICLRIIMFMPWSGQKIISSILWMVSATAVIIKQMISWKRLMIHGHLTSPIT